MSTNWFVRDQEKQRGPFTTSELRKLIRQGSITPRTLVRGSDCDQWVAAGSVRGLLEDPNSRGLSELQGAIDRVVAKRQVQGELRPQQSESVRPVELTEELIYRDSEVSVTTKRLMFYATTYALRNITSVRTKFTPVDRSLPVSAIALGVLIGIGSTVLIIVALNSPIPKVDATNSIQIGALGFAISVAVIICGVWWFMSLKTRYHAIVVTSSGEEHQISSYDQRYIRNVVNCINEAIARHH